MRPRRALAAVSALLGLASFALSVSAGEGDANPPNDLDVALSRFVEDRSDRESLRQSAEKRIGRGAAEISLLAGADSAKVAETLRREILANLKEKIDLKGEGLGVLPLSPQEILTTVVGYEVFKMRSYLSSGVFPKRYFGFVDRKWDTAERESVFLALVRDVARTINAHQMEKNRSVRLSDLEIVATYIAEGGALLFLEEKHLLEEGSERIDLGYHLGCDNMGAAIERHGDLAGRLDRSFGTALERSARKERRGETGDRAVGIARRVGFRESVVASGLMYLYEKEIAAEKLARKKKSGDLDGWPSADLMALPLAEQFIATSLVFNTGILFSREWVESIRDFRAIRRLSELSEANATKKGREWRPILPVDSSPEEAFRRLAARGYREQPTSWQGSYHVLQRYGAFRALLDLTDRFDAKGNWKG